MNQISFIAKNTNNEHYEEFVIFDWNWGNLGRVEHGTILPTEIQEKLPKINPAVYSLT